MKVPASIRSLYAARLPVIERLKSDVDQAMHALKMPRWHFESRIKDLESFCEKIEAGLVSDPKALEDFLACTLVVPNRSAIPDAVLRVSGRYDVSHRRPIHDDSTKKAANAFPFDDLRLYCRRANDGSRASAPIDDVVFEVQIKTFLQHAWSVATHDLSYKTDDARWGKDRIVAHLKAAIEHAELSIQEAEHLSRSPLLSMKQTRTDLTARIIEILKAFWERGDLPSNLRRSAETLQEILVALSLDPLELEEMLRAERDRIGSMPLNLSPYCVVIELLLKRYDQKIDALLATGRFRKKLFIPPEVSIPVGFPTAKAASHIVQIAI